MDNYNRKTIRYKRLRKEIEWLNEHGLHTSPIYLDEFDYLCVNINHTLTVKLSNHYPFWPPICDLKSGPYLGWLQELSMKLLDRGCLCCQSILCSENWSPAAHIRSIYDEYVSHRELVNIYFSCKLMNKIFEVRGLGDIDITKYLTSDLPSYGGNNRKSEKSIT